MMAADLIDVLVVGSCNIDLISYTPRLPKPGETIHGSRFCDGFGGKGANQCVAAARLGSKTAMVALLGSDIWGSSFREQLEKEGVNTKYVQNVPGKTTGMAQIIVSDDGENQIVIVVGANNLLDDKEVKIASELFNKSQVLICQLETPISGVVEALKKHKGISILNAAPALQNTPPELLKLPTILCVNEVEAAIMTDHKTIASLQDAANAAKLLLQKGANSVIITMGKEGALYASAADDKVVHVASPFVDKVVDTTGAGDAFIGALAHILVKKPDLAIQEKIAYASKVASISVQSEGTQSSFPRNIDWELNENITVKFL